MYGLAAFEIDGMLTRPRRRQGPKFADSLGGFMGRTVLDQTGIQGAYDFKLDWVKDQPAEWASFGASGASIFTAVQEQLGLSVERPTGN